MRNVIILGSGRSGTSMVAGTLAKAGYFMGTRLVPPRDSNPKGFFEDHEINDINENILKQVVPHRPRYIGRLFFRNRLGYMQKWLARVPLDTPIPCPPGVQPRIRRAVQHMPFCYKDPRFSYTLPVWRPYLKDTVFICVFRDPASTALSIVKECQQPYLRRLQMDFDTALEVWYWMYRHIVEVHRLEGEWLFIHFNQVLQPVGLDRLEAFTGARVDRSFPDPSLRRSISKQPVPATVRSVYEQLCALAEYPSEDIPVLP